MTSDLDRPEDPTYPWLIRKRARVILLDRLIKLFYVLLAVAILGLLVADYAQGRKARQEILDCQVESGECFKRNQREIAQILSRIDRDNLENLIGVVECARATSTTEQFDACVDRVQKENR